MPIAPIVTSICVGVALGFLIYAAFWSSPPAPVQSHRQPTNTSSWEREAPPNNSESSSSRRNSNFKKPNKRRCKVTEDSCSICLESINNICVLLRCSHIFHQHCFKKLIEHEFSPLCPNCRKDAYIDYQGNISGIDKHLNKEI